MTTDISCPYCKRLTYMDYVEHSARIVEPREMRVEAAFQCANCKRFSVGGLRHAGFTTDNIGQAFAFQLHEGASPGDIARVLIGNVEYWEPIAPVGKSYDHLPADIAGPADEAYRCLSIEAHRAAVLMARSVIEATAKAKGITSRGIMTKINELAEKGYIRPLVAEAAHKVRELGNEMAHGDFATSQITRVDAEDVLVLMDEILNDAFAVPNRLAALNARRDQTGDATTTPVAE
jgi:hypothetical protein